jgi:hypothetical protein
MRFLIANSDYPSFITSLYSSSPGLERRSYLEQLSARRETHFSVVGSYSAALRQLGHDATDIVINNARAQGKWAEERNIHRYRGRAPSFRLRRDKIPWLSWPQEDWLRHVFSAQVADYEPDVLLMQDMFVSTRFLAALKPNVEILIGQHAATPLQDDQDWSVYDLVISSFPPTVDWFRARDIPAILNELAFDAQVTRAIGPAKRDIPVSFVGSFQPIHRSRTELLEHVARNLPLQVWGPAPPSATDFPALARSYLGTAWGLDMYRIFARSSIVLNHHGNVPPFANNFRLFEATGMGALLVTDSKPNLPELFAVGTEVVAYENADECVRLINDMLQSNAKRQRISAAGQRRTLTDHTFVARMESLIRVLERFNFRDRAR